MKKNEDILKERTLLYNQIQGARVGDFLELPTGQYVIFSHNWGNKLQTSSGGFLYLGNGYISFSGGLDSGIKTSDIEPTQKTKKGSIWFFDGDISGAGRGVYFEIDFRVFKLKSGADTSGIPQIEAFYKKQIQDAAEKVTRINGNGQPYTLPLPEVRIAARELNDVYLKHVLDNTGMTFKKCAWDYAAQPMKNEQLVKFLTMGSFKTTFYNNAAYHNTLMVEFI